MAFEPVVVHAWPVSGMSCQGVVEYGFPGTALHGYQCHGCHEAGRSAAAPLLPMSCPPRTAPPPGTRCSTCGGLIQP